MMEIMTNGPVEAGFDVYEDFPTYTSGIYFHAWGELKSGHAVKIVGWGEENGIPYWVIANSWNEGWGENGFVRFLRGMDECGIESEITAGMTDLDALLI
ncbi:Cathepsin B [Paragonimus heterotremus]|uniref:Cathepsin B n=1 Tax=Paragonimus heterotremus TaxID=100268 RepID=A0A8J4SJ99_9TREM|nr:Cathepsin B [Paragonimus heterotremus]